MARPALTKAGEVYFILAKGAARDPELGEILYGLNLYAKLPLSSIEPLSTLERLVPGLGLQNKSEVLHVALCRQPLKTLLIELLSQLDVPLGDGSLVLSDQPGWERQPQDRDERARGQLSIPSDCGQRDAHFARQHHGG